MQPRDVFTAAAQLAVGRGVRVLDARGAAYEPPAPPLPPVVEPDPIVEQLARIEHGNLAARVALMSVSAGLADVTQAVQAVASGQGAIASGVAGVEATLRAPVEPVYDGSGKIIGAQRRAKKGA